MCSFQSAISSLYAPTAYMPMIMLTSITAANPATATLKYCIANKRNPMGTMRSKNANLKNRLETFWFLGSAKTCPKVARLDDILLHMYMKKRESMGGKCVILPIWLMGCVVHVFVCSCLLSPVWSMCLCVLSLVIVDVFTCMVDVFERKRFEVQVFPEANTLRFLKSGAYGLLL